MCGIHPVKQMYVITDKTVWARQSHRSFSERIAELRTGQAARSNTQTEYIPAW